ncbi:unnamed protein product, partial [Effrenium voratum]
MGKPTPRLPGAFGCLVPGRDDPRHQGGDSFQEATPVCEQEVGCQRHASHGDHGGGAEARLTRGFLDRDQRHGLRPWAIFAGRGKASRRQEYPAETIGADRVRCRSSIRALAQCGRQRGAQSSGSFRRGLAGMEAAEALVEVLPQTAARGNLALIPKQHII